MQFSNCTSRKDACGYSEFGKPQSSGDVSILLVCWFFRFYHFWLFRLTSIATSLLCEADVEESRVLGSLKTITAYIPKLGRKDFDEDLSDIIDVENTEDKKYLLVSFMYQVSRDCSSYRSGLSDMVGTIRWPLGSCFCAGKVIRKTSQVLLWVGWVKCYGRTHSWCNCVHGYQCDRGTYEEWPFI